MRRLARPAKAAQRIADPRIAATARRPDAPLADVRVTILGSHATDGVSMRRFTELLEQAYKDNGAQVTTRRPPGLVSSRLQSHGARKWVGYVEKFILFPFTACSAVRHADLVHISDHSNAHWLLWRHVRGISVVTCHDLFAVRAARGELAEHTPGRTGKAYQRLVEAGMRRAEAVECDSHATLGDAERLFPGVRTMVVHIGVDPRLTPDPTASVDHSGFALVVAPVGWRKRREDSIGVWQKLRTHEDLKALGLIIVGPELTELESSALSDLERSQVRVLTAASDGQLANLYVGAAFVITMSRYEGFGWPIVEGQSLGTTALCSDIPVHREVGGDGAVYLGQTPPDWDVDQVVRQLLDPGMRSRALHNAAQFAYPAFSARIATATYELLTSQTQ